MWVAPRKKTSAPTGMDAKGSGGSTFARISAGVSADARRQAVHSLVGSSRPHTHAQSNRGRRKGAGGGVKQFNCRVARR